jgi:hypothetical protein
MLSLDGFEFSKVNESRVLLNLFRPGVRDVEPRLDAARLIVDLCRVLVNLGHQFLPLGRTFPGLRGRSVSETIQNYPQIRISAGNQVLSPPL